MTISLYPDIVHTNDLSPDHGGADVDDICAEIYNATKGWGANKQKVIDALATIDSTKRTYVAIRYKELHNIELSELMKKEFSGDFGLALEFLSLRPDEAEVKMLRRAHQGVGANVNIIWSILLGRTNAEIDIIRKKYFARYTKDLSKVMASELHGNMERLIFNALQAGEEVYDPQYHSPDKALEDAEFIYKKGQGSWGTDERSLFKIFCASPTEHLENVSKIYSDKYGYTLLKTMEKELGGVGEGNLREACLYLLGMKLKPYETMAKAIKLACAGFGTDELLLTCCLIRYQHVMPQVMTAHIELYGKTIHDRVREEVGGKYKTLLLQVVNTAWPEEG